MKNYIYTLTFKSIAKILFLNAIFIIPIYSQSTAETNFNTICRACHTIGQGRLVGPDLANLSRRRSVDWIIKFVKSSQSVIKNNDSVAVKLFNEYNKIVMPDQSLTDTQIIELINYIKEKSPVEEKSAENITTGFSLTNSMGMTLQDAGKEEVEIGLKYFSGKKKFENNGPSCISCHNVVNDNLIGGGELSKDLTTAYSRLNAAGVDAIISNPPFPVMNIAFKDKPLTADEKYYLIAFLKKADYDSVYQHKTDYKSDFLFSGIFGAAVLSLAFGLIWFRRKKHTVKKEIFNRQIKSSN